MPQIYDEVLGQWVDSETGKTSQTIGSETPPEKPVVTQPEPTQPETPPPQAAGVPTPPPLSIVATSGADKFAVQVPVIQDGKVIGYGSDILSKLQIEARGWTLPIEAARESELHQIEVTQGAEARKAKESEYRAQDLALAPKVAPLVFQTKTPDDLLTKGLSLSLNPNERYALPEAAKAIRFDANNNPIAYEFEGEIYYPPGSLQYEMGWRTESDRIQGGAEHPYGIYHGNQIPDNTVIEVDAQGNPLRRYTSEDYASGQLSSLDNMGNLRYPVKNQDNQEVLLTKEQYTKLTSAVSNEDRLSVAKELKLVPDSMSLKEFTGEAQREAQAAYNASLFVAQQENKRNQLLKEVAIADVSKFAKDKNIPIQDVSNLTGDQITQLVASGIDANKLVLIGNNINNVNNAIKEYNDKVLSQNAELKTQLDKLETDKVALSKYQVPNQPDFYYIADYVKDNPNSEALELLQRLNVSPETLKLAQEYVNIVNQYKEELSARDKSQQLFYIAQTFGFSKRQELSKLDNPLNALSSKELQEVIEKYAYINRPLDEVRAEAFNQLKQEWANTAIMTGLIAGSVIGAGVAGVVGTILRGATTAGMTGLAGYGYYQTTTQELQPMIQKGSIELDKLAVSYGIDTLMLAGALQSGMAIRFPKNATPEQVRTTLSGETATRLIDNNLSSEIAKLDTGSRVTKAVADLATLKDRVIVEARDLPTNIKDAAKVAFNELDYAIGKLGDAIKESPQKINEAIRNANFDTQLAISKLSQVVKDLPDDVKYQANKLITDANLLTIEAKAVAEDVGKVIINDVDFAVNKTIDAVKSTPDVARQSVFDLRVAVDTASKKVEQLPYQVAQRLNNYSQELRQASKDLKTSASMAGKIISNDVAYGLDRVIQIARTTPGQLSQAVTEAKARILLLERDIELTSSSAVRVAFNEIQYALDRLVEIVKNSPERINEAIDELDQKIYEAKVAIKRELSKVGELPENIREQSSKALLSLEEKIHNATNVVVDASKVTLNDVSARLEYLSDVIKTSPDKAQKALQDVDLAIFKAKTTIQHLPDNIATQWNISLNKAEVTLRDIKQTLNNSADRASQYSKSLWEDIRYQSEQLPKLISESPELARQALQQIKDDLLYLQREWEYQKRDFNYGVEEAKLTKPLIEQLKNIQNRLNNGSITPEEAASQVSYLQSSDDWIALRRAKEDIRDVRLSETVSKMLETHNIQPSDFATRLADIARVVKVSGETWEEALDKVNSILSQKNLTDFEKAMLDWEIRARKLPLELQEATIKQIKEAEQLGKEFIVEQKKIPETKQEELDQIDKDITHNENTLDNAERLREQTTNPERQKTLDDHIEKLKRSIEQKKQQKQVAEQEKVVIPGVKIAEVGKELPAKVEETTKELSKVEPVVKESIPEPPIRPETIRETRRYAGQRTTLYPTQEQEELALVIDNGVVRFAQLTPTRLINGWTIEFVNGQQVFVSPDTLTQLSPNQLEELKRKTIGLPDIREYSKTMPEEGTQIKPAELPQESVKPEIKPAPFEKPLPFEQPAIKPLEELKPKEELKPIEPIPTREKIITSKIIQLPKKKEEEQKIVENPSPGTIVWIQGRPMYLNETHAPMYKVLTPDSDVPFTTRLNPKGYVDEGFTGEGSAFKSIQVIGGMLPQDRRNIDLGFVRINVLNRGGKPVIEFAQDVDSNVGERSKTVGQGKGQIPIEEWEAAKAQGIPFDEFVRTYKGHLEGEAHPIDISLVPSENTLDKVELTEYKTPQTKVFLVNGGYVRDNIYQDYTQGGHWKVYPEFIPQGEIWIDRALDTTEDRKATLLHELVEMEAMKDDRGRDNTYSEVHNNIANPAEQKGRQNPELLDNMINDILSKYIVSDNRPLPPEEVIKPLKKTVVNRSKRGDNSSKAIIL